jgi:FG-GAP-like repeat
MKTIPLLLVTTSLALAAEPPEPKFTAVTLDDKIQIGYGLAIADVDGDKAPDVLLADKRQIVWYRNPGPAKAREPGAWTKHLIAENLTEKDNVCLAAQDLDGDGKCELAVGAEWNPGDTEKSGAVFYLIPPADRTQRWEPVKFPSVEPTTHRMRWIKMREDFWALFVLPLHGRGNKNGQGATVKMTYYLVPQNRNDPKADWLSQSFDTGMHMTHNFEYVEFQNDIRIAGLEGVAGFDQRPTGIWVRSLWMDGDRAPDGMKGAGELSWMRDWPDEKLRKPIVELVTIEPMHGNRLVVYNSVLNIDYFQIIRRELTDRLIEGHALKRGDLLGVKSDQIVVGWRGNPANPNNTFGIHLWTPLDATGEKWRDSAVDDGGMACEDLQLGDLDGDGRPDIAASGRATKNVKLYFNDTPR